MNAQSIEGSARGRVPRWRPSRRIAAAVFGGVLVVGALVAWGPIGVGNGPLNSGLEATQGWADVARQPAGLVIPMRNSGSAPAVIDAVEIIGGTRYDAPHVLALRVLTRGDCGAAWPVRQTARGFELSGCGGPDSGPLIGQAVGATKPGSFGFPAAAEVAAPRPGACWVMTKIVVHYHVGIRHYSASDPYQLVVCADHTLVDAAMAAAETAS